MQVVRASIVIVFVSQLLSGCAMLGVRGSKTCAERPRHGSAPLGSTRPVRPIPDAHGGHAEAPNSAGGGLTCAPCGLVTSANLTIVDVDRAPDSSHFIADGHVFETTCYSVDRFDKLVFPGVPTEPGVRVSIVAIDDERECSATLLVCTRASVMSPMSFEGQDDGRLALSDGTEWETYGYIYERYYSDAYICPAEGKLLVDDKVLNVVRVR